MAKDLVGSTVIARNSEIVTANMDGEIVMMSVENGKYYNLGKMGSVIWDILEFPLSFEDLLKKLLATYNIKKEQCEKDVSYFLHQLKQENIIVLAEKI